ncbi:hypothetical protein N9C36_02820 [Candidatus Pelagibacter sp.]|nr:hypothetical protein [Candidatus Pelagibacter sp.]
MTLHSLLETFYNYFFNYNPFNKPILLKVISYLTPFLVITFLLLLFKKNKKIKFFYAIFGLSLSFIVVTDLFKIRESELKSIKDTNQISLSKNNKKVLWILYDALDPDYLEKKIDNDYVFQTFLSLKKSGIYYKNAYSPGIFTNDSVPAQLLETNIKKRMSLNRTSIFENLDGDKIPFIFKNTFFSELNDSNLSVSLLSSVLEYCSSYLRSSRWQVCKDRISENKYQSIEASSLKFFLNIFFKTLIFSKEKFLNSDKVNNFKSTSIKKINFKDLDFDELNIKSGNSDNFPSDHMEIINPDEIIKTMKVSNMTFVHVYNPHNHRNVDFFIKKFGYDPNLTIDQYLFRYLYVDLFTKNVLQKIKENFDNEVLVVISSDHWNRDKNTDKDYVGRSFMLIKNLDDEANFTVNKKNSTIIIPKLIKNYFFTNSNSNKDIFEYSNTLDEPIHIKRNRF